MPSETKIPPPPKQDDSSASETADKKLDRIADDAAKKAGKTEQNYDEGRNIFTK
jgi:hypothetical protein